MKKGEQIFIYCNVETLALRTGVKPIRVSKVLLDNYFLSYCIALFDLKELNSIPNQEFMNCGAWWRGINRMNTSLDSEKGFYGRGYKPRVMRLVGLLSYIRDQYHVSTEKNVAAVIGEFAVYEGKDPISFFNSIRKL